MGKELSYAIMKYSKLPNYSLKRKQRESISTEKNCTDLGFMSSKFSPKCINKQFEKELRSNFNEKENNITEEKQIAGYSLAFTV